MWTFIFVTTTIICALGWATNYVSTLAMIYYIEKKGYTQPTEKELEECTRSVVKHLLG